MYCTILILFYILKGYIIFGEYMGNIWGIPFSHIPNIIKILVIFLFFIERESQ